MDSRALRFLLASALVLLCDASGGFGVSYHGEGESTENKNIVFGGFKRHRRQTPAQTTNVTSVDNHRYYTSTFYGNGSAEAERLWFDLTSLDGVQIIPESGISDSFRVFSPHILPFNFQFYGHTINLVAVTTGGFLYTSDYLHSQIHLTQYIAPLQADFDPSHSPSARVLIHSSSERFTVQWDRVRVIDHIDEGEFTFQVSLFRNGTIHFVYRNIPLLISEIIDDFHPVEVGLADSFYIDRPIPPNLILRQVFEYSRIQLDEDDLSFSAYVIDPLPGCVPADTCERCMQATQISEFQCGWCHQLSRCSDGLDRFRQEWVESGCLQDGSTSCTVPTTAASGQLSSGAVAGISVGLILILVLAVSIVLVVIGILVYGYRNPTSSVGMFMIEHRPKARSLNKTKASYDVSSGKASLAAN